MLKYLLNSLLLFIIVSAQAQSDFVFNISGNFSTDYIPKEKKIFISKVDYDYQDEGVIDSLTISETGSFKKSISINEADIFSVSYSGKTQFLIAVDYPQELINLQISASNYSVTGSKGSILLQEYENFRKTSFAKIVSPVNQKISKADEEKDKKLMEKLNREYVISYSYHRSELTDFVRKNMMNSVASYAAVLRFNPDEDITFMDSLYLNINTLYPKSKVIQKLKSKIERFKNVALGAKAPDINLPDNSKKNISLYSLQADYILIDFWASWCIPCRQESATLVKNYANYKNKGFEIFSVSLDTEFDKWNHAIVKDGYLWANVSDLKAWKSAAAFSYNVTAIPANFLVDKQGKIIAKNLRGTALEEKLAELLKK
jgi:peroxiredoxin